MSRAEELKALVASDNRLSFEEARTARDVLRGKEPVSVPVGEDTLSNAIVRTPSICGI